MQSTPKASPKAWPAPPSRAASMSSDATDKTDGMGAPKEDEAPREQREHEQREHEQREHEQCPRLNPWLGHRRPHRPGRLHVKQPGDDSRMLQRIQEGAQQRPYGVEAPHVQHGAES